jgi:hypothetical protein
MEISKNANRATVRLKFHRMRDFFAHEKQLASAGLAIRILKREWLGDSPTMTFLIKNTLPISSFNEEQRSLVNGQSEAPKMQPVKKDSIQERYWFMDLG